MTQNVLVIPGGFLGNIPCSFLVLVPRTGNELGMNKEWTRTDTREFERISQSKNSLSIPCPFPGFLGDSWDSWGIHKELVGESKDREGSYLTSQHGYTGANNGRASHTLPISLMFTKQRWQWFLLSRSFSPICYYSSVLHQNPGLENN